MSRLCPYYDDSGLIWYGWAQVRKDCDVNCSAVVPKDVSNIINDYLGHTYDHYGVRTRYSTKEIRLLSLEDIDVKSLSFMCLDGSNQTIEVSTPQGVPAIWTGRGKLYINCEIIRPAFSTARAWPKDTTRDVCLMVNRGLPSERYSWEDIREEVATSFRGAGTTRDDIQPINVIFGCGPKLYPGVPDDNMARLLE